MNFVTILVLVLGQLFLIHFKCCPLYLSIYLFIYLFIFFELEF